MIRLFIALMCFSFCCYGDQVYIHSSSGEQFPVEINPEDKFGDVMALLESYVSSLENENQENIHIVSNEPAYISLNNPKREFVILSANAGNFKGSRDYSSPVTPKQKEDIRYIVKTLSTCTWMELVYYKTTLEKVGARVNLIHPLRTLLCILTDKELAIGIGKVREDALVWSQFFGGLSKNLEEEFKNGNMKAEDVTNFANILGVNFNTANAFIQKRKWKEFVDFLLYP